MNIFLGHYYNGNKVLKWASKCMNCWNNIIVLIVIPTFWGDDDILHLPWHFSEAKWGGMLVNCCVVELRMYNIDWFGLFMTKSGLPWLNETYIHKIKKICISKQHQQHGQVKWPWPSLWMTYKNWPMRKVGKPFLLIIAHTQDTKVLKLYCQFVKRPLI